MQRSRLKNIINKSMQTPVGAFDKFKQSLPIKVDDNYRLESAWKAYGSPKNYKEALWQGLIQPIDENTYKFPSIGYNEETDEYEYLNKGKDNETVAKDIRVWDNDVIPLVKELKLGGYVRTFNEEKDCWTYTKNSQKREQPIEDKGKQVIEQFKQGKKINTELSVPSDLFEIDENGDYLYWGDDDRAIEWLKNNKDFTKQYKQWGIPEDGEKTRLVNKKRYDQLWFEKNKGAIFKSLRTTGFPNLGEYQFMTPDGNPAKIATGEFTPDGQQLYETPEGQLYTMKQGGQMNVIPEGALHARKNNMEGAGEDFTAKGIPVVDNNGEQQAEIETNELILRKKVTEQVEDLYKRYNEEESQQKKDSIAIEMGKIITCEITKNTDDKTGLIQNIQEKM